MVRKSDKDFDEIEVPSVDEYVVDINDIEDVEPLPKQKYVAEITDVQVRRVENRNDGSVVTKVSVAYHISTQQFPPNYDIENAPDGMKLYTPYSGYNVDCGDGMQPSRRGAAQWKKFLKNHGYEGTVRFVRRDDLDGHWSVDQQTLDELVGKLVEVLVDHNKYEGEIRTQISSISKLD